MAPLPSAVHRWLGSILILISAASFGFMPLFRSFAGGVSVPMMLMLRFAMAAVVLGGLCILGRQSFPRGRLLLILLAMGALGYFGEAYLYFSALQYAPSGMVSLLLYTYPAIVTIISVALLKERLNRGRLLALLLAIAGSALTAIPGLLGPGHQRTQPLGVVLGLACAASYAAYILVGARLPNTAKPLPSSALVCAGASLMFGLVVLARAGRQAEPLPQSGAAWAGIAALALICTVIGVTAFLAGLPRVGSIRASTLSAFEPVVTATIGALALNEQFSSLQVVGGGLIVTAAVLSAQAQGAAKAGAATPVGAASSTS